MNGFSMFITKIVYFPQTDKYVPFDPTDLKVYIWLITKVLAAHERR